MQIQISENQKRCLHEYVKSKPVFTLFHDNQVEVISTFPYLAASAANEDEAIANWLASVEDWVEALETSEEPLSKSEKRRFTMPINQRFFYSMSAIVSMIAIGLVKNAAKEPKQAVDKWAWQSLIAH